jgi:pentatricopeptide repeat protein
MKLLSNIDPSATGPSSFSYNSALRASAKSGNAQEAKRLLKEMEDANRQAHSVTYCLVIQALANSDGGEKAALEAEEVLKSSIGVAKANSYTYEGLMTAWGKSKTGVRGALRAQEIFEHTEKLYMSGNHNLKPLTMNINAVIKAWEQSQGGVQAATKSESILRRMDPLAVMNATIGNGHIDIWPNSATISAVANAWIISGAPDAPEQAERILHYVDGWNTKVPVNRQIQPSVDTYNNIIAAHAKVKGRYAARRAEAILYRLVNLEAPAVASSYHVGTRALDQWLPNVQSSC